MAQKIVVYWRDIPAQIIVKSGRKKARRELPERFIQAVDRAAMKVGAKDSDAYLAEWRQGQPEKCSDDLEQVADAEAARLDATYTADELKRLIGNGGFSR